MYFWIVWKTPELSMEELTLVQPTNISKKNWIVFFDTKLHELLPKLWWLIKWWKVGSKHDLEIALQDVKIVWVDSQELGLMIKRQFGVKRYKVLEQRKSDLEVKKKWKEVFSFGKGEYWIVWWWQPIDLYEAIDFGKPASGMQIWMMPTKLAHILTNVGVAQIPESSHDEITIYDPFAGFWTTNFISNFLWYHTIGSDINITQAKQNNQWRQLREFYQKEAYLTFFKHDVNDVFKKPFLDKVSVIITEGRLWPVVKKEMLKHKNQTEAILKEYIPSVVELYATFMENSFAKWWSSVPIVMTVPEYLRLDHPVIANRITEHAQTIWYEVRTIEEVYHRKKQLVGRRVLILE